MARRRRPVRNPWHTNPLGLRPVARQPLPDRIARLLRRAILAGELRPGEKVESLRTLSRELGVGIGAVREALAQLKAEGLVEIRHGAGTFVARRARRARTLRAAVRQRSRREVAELRLTVEPALARAAAARHTRDGFSELHFLHLERLVAAHGPDPTAFVTADAAFHLQVARMSASPIGIAAHRLAAPMLRPEMEVRAREHAADERLQRLHWELMDAIGAGRVVRAERAARAIVVRERRPP